MNALRLAWKNLRHRPLNTTFNMLLMALSGGLITLGFLVSTQFEDHFGKNLGPAELVLSAKGSPLQSVLCNLFHLDAPTGNISLEECRPFLNPRHPVIAQSLPLALGDQAMGSRLVGTTTEYGPWYRLQLAEGRWFEGDFQAVLGSDVARKSKLRIGDRFVSDHGLAATDIASHQHADDSFVVTGILQSSGTVSDRLILVTISSYWSLHHEEHAEGGEPHHHGPPCLTNEDLAAADGKITSLLCSFRGRNVQSLNFGRNVNENTGLMATSPAIEINRLYEITGNAASLLSNVAFLLVFLALLSLFISLWQAMEDRRYELALLRFAGARPGQLLRWTMAESAMLSLLGILSGMIAAHLLLALLNPSLGLEARYGIRPDRLFPGEWLVPLAGLVAGMLAGLLPALRALRTDIHHTLSEG